MSSASPHLPDISEHIWDLKYRLRSADGAPIDKTLDDTWRRVANALAGAEKRSQRSAWADRFYGTLKSLEFLPAGRIIAGAGSGRDVTLFNCFVMGAIEDDLGAIFDGVKEAALTMQKGGGIGHDFSTLRPAGALVRSVGAGASGPVSFMDVWDAMCRTIMSAGQRRGAMMATLACDHPDILAFIDAKSDPARLRNFNLSVLVTDAFMTAVRDGRDWSLQFGGHIYRTLPARELWDRIMQATYAYAEPGVIFIDRINALNTLAYCEDIRATNPCGEQPLPPYGACLLGSVNLTRLVVEPFTERARLDEARLAEVVAVAVRLLDNAIDVSAYPLPAQKAEAKAKRRIGLGLTGLADALAMCGLRYGSSVAADAARRWMSLVEHHAAMASTEIASEKGAFPRFDRSAVLASPNITRLAPDVRDRIAKKGLRNGCLTSIAPTGTISLLAGNVSSGIEPIFDLSYTRRIREREETREQVVQDYAYGLYRQRHASLASPPDVFVTANMLTPNEHLVMQAAVQAHVDSSISKTVNCAETISFEAFKSIYLDAYEMGLKGCTTFRPNAVTGSILTARAVEPTADAPATGTAALPAPSAGPAPHDAGARIETPLKPRPILAKGETADGIVYMAPPLARDPVLAGFTYKLAWAGSDHALYLTINDIERDGRRRPYEIFINTRNLEHYAWTVALTRMISAVFRRGGDVTFVVTELKAIFDPQGGQWMAGRYVPSLLAAIGEIIEAHMVRIGFIQDQAAEARASVLLAAAAGGTGDAQTMYGTPDTAPIALTAPGKPSGSQGAAGYTSPDRSMSNLRQCPRCSEKSLRLEAGCWTCRECGFSKCG